MMMLLAFAIALAGTIGLAAWLGNSARFNHDRELISELRDLQQELEATAEALTQLAESIGDREVPSATDGSLEGSDSEQSLVSSESIAPFGRWDDEPLDRTDRKARRAPLLALV